MLGVTLILAFPFPISTLILESSYILFLDDNLVWHLDPGPLLLLSLLLHLLASADSLGEVLHQAAGLHDICLKQHLFRIFLQNIYFWEIIPEAV